MKKILLVLNLLVIFQPSNNLMSQTLSLYKVDSKITSELFDVYLLLYPSGKYYLISEYNYGEPMKNFYEGVPSASDVLPVEILLSFGTYTEKDTTVTLTDAWYNFQQSFSLEGNCLNGVQTFDCLNGKSLYIISQDKKSNYLEYRGGILRAEDFEKRYDSLFSRFRQMLNSQKIRIKKSNSVSTRFQNGKFVESDGLFYFVFNNCQFSYYLDSLLLFKGKYSISGNEIFLKCNGFGAVFSLLIVNDSTLSSVKLPSVLPGHVFNLKNITPLNTSFERQR